VVLLAFDDTDSVQGGCTTYTAFELIRRLEGIDLIGPPRLVRLNPAVPHKTRGNGALCVRLGHGRGRPIVAGRDGDRPLEVYADGDRLDEAEADRVFEAARRLIDATARLDSPKTHPGLLLFERAPPPEIYDAAVSRYVGRTEAEPHWRGAARVASWKEGRGLLGAAAAAAWPARRFTYEWIAYRAPERWGTPRRLEGDLGALIDREHPTTFDNYDPEHEHLRIAPASPCPILAGVRGTDPAELERAVHRLGPEQAAGGLLFLTNQATDDQFRSAEAGRLRPYTSPILALRIVGAPRTWKGGHVFVRAADETGEVDLVAYEPTKEFRAHVRRLGPGDGVRVHGAVGADPRLVALERLEVVEPSRRRQVAAPSCPACGGGMKNRGRGEAHACMRCGAVAAAKVVETTCATAGVVEVPVSVRRHLTRPLKLAGRAA